LVDVNTDATAEMTREGMIRGFIAKMRGKSVGAIGTQFLQDNAKLRKSILVNRIRSVYKWVELVASLPVCFDKWVRFVALHKIIPFLWIGEAVL